MVETVQAAQSILARRIRPKKTVKKVVKKVNAKKNVVNVSKPVPKKSVKAKIIIKKITVKKSSKAKPATKSDIKPLTSGIFPT